jgi:hypothetical protein
MKKKTKEITESNGKPAKPVNDTDNKKPKENESDKNGEVDRYAFTDEDASPVTYILTIFITHIIKIKSRSCTSHYAWNASKHFPSNHRKKTHKRHPLL